MWAGSSHDKAIERAQTKESVGCDSSAFDDYVCMTYEDFQSFYMTYVAGCKQWDSAMQMMPTRAALKEVKEVRDAKAR